MKPSPDRVAHRFLLRQAATVTKRVSVGPSMEIALWYDQGASMGFLHTLVQSAENLKKDLDKALAGTDFAKLLKWHDPVIGGDKDGLAIRIKTPDSRGFLSLRQDQKATQAVMKAVHRHGFKLT